MPPRFVRQAVANNTAQSLVLSVLLGTYLLAAVAARVPSLKLHIPLISTLRIGFRIRLRLPQLLIIHSKKPTTALPLPVISTWV